METKRLTIRSCLYLWKSTHQFPFSPVAPPPIEAALVLCGAGEGGPAKINDGVRLSVYYVF